MCNSYGRIFPFPISKNPINHSSNMTSLTIQRITTKWIRNCMYCAHRNIIGLFVPINQYLYIILFNVLKCDDRLTRILPRNLNFRQLDFFRCFLTMPDRHLFKYPPLTRRNRFKTALHVFRLPRRLTVVIALRCCCCCRHAVVGFIKVKTLFIKRESLFPEFIILVFVIPLRVFIQR